MKPAIKKETGVKHFFAAATYSWGGFRRLLEEAAFRQELVFFVIALALFAVVGATLVEFVVLVILFLMMFAFEALNTAVEELVDRISPEISAVGKNAKDLGSFAVLCTIAATGLYVLFTVGSGLYLLTF